MHTRTRKPTILVVDDTPTNIEILSEVLVDEDYEVLFATSGQEALEIAFGEVPDLVMLDVMMPGMDGYQVCRRLKADPVTKGIPVIFVTAMGEETDEAKGLGIGAIDYLTKPIRPPIVRARVRNHLELKKYQDFLERLSFTNGLTGIYNRRGFDLSLEREWRRARRNRTYLSLIMMDIDFFKAFNDHYGHLSGDDCLRQVARSLEGCARRPVDVVARYGGEEFACLLPDTDTRGAVWVANQIRNKLKSLNIPHAWSSVADHVTMSLGVAATIPVVGQEAVDLIQSADRLLYIAKDNGRDQVRSALDQEA